MILPRMSRASLFAVALISLPLGSCAQVPDHPREGEPELPARNGKPLLVHVVDEIGDPVRGAHVRCIALTDFEEDSPGSRISSRDLDELAARLGKGFLSDENGLVRIPDRPDGYCIAAEKDGWTGLLFRGQFDDPLGQEGDETEYLVLSEDRALRVHVVDAAASRQREPGRAALPEPRASRGRLLHHDRRERRGADPPPARSATGRCRADDGTSVAAVLLATTPIESALRLGSLPSTPIELVVPDTGSLRSVSRIRAAGSRTWMRRSNSRPRARRSERTRQRFARRSSRSARCTSRSRATRPRRLGLAPDVRVGPSGWASDRGPRGRQRAAGRKWS